MNKTQLQQKETEDWKAKYLRALADYQNLEKRTIEARTENAKHANEQLVYELLGSLDILEKAEQHLQDKEIQELLKSGQTKLSAIFEGVKHGTNGFLQSLKAHGLKRIEVLNKKFDPEKMECVEVVESDKENEVIGEVRPGYMIWDKIIRVAQVKVGKKKENK